MQTNGRTAHHLALSHDQGTYSGLITPNNTLIHWEKHVLDHPDGYESPIWRSEVQLRIHSAMLEVALAKRGTVIIGGECCLLQELDNPIYQEHIGALGFKQMLRPLREGQLIQMALPFTKMAWTIYKSGGDYEAFGLSIRTVGLPNSPGWGI